MVKSFDEQLCLKPLRQVIEASHKRQPAEVIVLYSYKQKNKPHLKTPANKTWGLKLNHPLLWAGKAVYSTP